MQDLSVLNEIDPEIYTALCAEIERQQDGIEMIPSENYASRAVITAIGTVLTNKYSEGYVRKRYYGGNENIDTVEQLAIDRAKALFKADHANVQPYSGSPANLAVYYALATPGDTTMGMGLADGGHLTHGSKVSFSGHWFNAIPYSVDPVTCRIDFDAVARLAREHKPKLIWAGASAYSRQIDFAKFAEIAHEVGARFAADIAHISGLVATGLHPDPVPVADAVTMTTHKMLRGPRAGLILCKAEHAKAIDKAVFPGLQGGPHDHITAAVAVALHEASQPGYKAYCEQVIKNAQALAEALMSRGVAVVSGGTDNHLVLADLSSKNVPGKVATAALDRAHITVNANMVPGDKRTAMDPSGVRMGSPAATTRGFKEAEMKQIGNWLVDVVEHVDDDAAIARVSGEVEELCGKFPLWF